MAIDKIDIWNADEEPRLSAVLSECWALLLDGASDPKHDLYTPALATNDPAHGAMVRTVVLRHVDRERRQLTFYTDLRSRKVGEIQADPRVSLLFLAHSDDTQIRVQAEARIHHGDALAEEAWAEVSLSQRRYYMVSGPPGLPWAWPTSGLPERLENHPPGKAESQIGKLNFAVVVCTVSQMDWLYLTPYGHRRATFAWNQAGQLQTSWLVP
ncbi:hypothetical protein HBA54_23865 [Pelagibius litoralis]|uniref:Pyridoxamine 5'-phosphate oxidase N-terminal domain-containing protein n=1 Tax=Pelagibius litoralis TaxID=374515 RepID=A0A967F243_9PROT|nr:pyridoxamine 5'-phosphate oxidase family protein [Pelagibius litoralis]NIA71633.1 hypothetical protein [Pelagibius litoralis]